MKEEFSAMPPGLHSTIKTNHEKLVNMLQEIKSILRHLTKNPSSMHRELILLYLQFLDFLLEVEIHFAKEAVAVLPFIRRYTEELNKNPWERKPRLFSACPPIDLMYHEHKKEKEQFNLLFEKFTTFQFKESAVHLSLACEKLRQFKALWNAQLHLEDDILFPGIIEMESILDPFTSKT